MTIIVTGVATTQPAPIPEHRVLWGRVKALDLRVDALASTIRVSRGRLYAYFRGELKDGLRTGEHRRLLAELERGEAALVAKMTTKAA